MRTGSSYNLLGTSGVTSGVTPGVLRGCRHIVVYKEGFEPPDIDVHLDKSRVTLIVATPMFSRDTDVSLCMSLTDNPPEQQASERAAESAARSCGSATGDGALAGDKVRQAGSQDGSRDSGS